MDRDKLIARQEAETVLKQRRDSFELQTVRKLLRCYTDEAKDRLLSCDIGNFLKVQGEAAAYDKVLKALEAPGMDDIMKAQRSN